MPDGVAEELALPWGVTGPRDLAPLARAARMRFSEIVSLITALVSGGPGSLPYEFLTYQDNRRSQ